MTDQAASEPLSQLRGRSGSRKLHVLITKEQLAAAVGRLAAEITRDFAGKRPLIIGILKGSFVFLADLVRLVDLPVQIDLVRLASYGSGTESSGHVTMTQTVELPVRDRDVLIVDDIVDTGLSLDHFVRHLQQFRPQSVRICTLLDKPSRRQVAIQVDYVGISIPDKFVVGYGLDCNEEYRNLGDICVVEA